MPPEQWLPARGFEDRYEVSSLGRIRHKSKPEKIILGERHEGYRRASLTNNHGVPVRVFIHRIVAESFIGPRAGRFVNHKNSIRDDNRAENLEWVTMRENVRHGWRDGFCRALKGSAHGGALVTEQQVVAIRTLCVNARRGTQAALANALNLSPSAISTIVRRKNWRHL